MLGCTAYCRPHKSLSSHLDNAHQSKPNARFPRNIGLLRPVHNHTIPKYARPSEAQGKRPGPTARESRAGEGASPDQVITASPARLPSVPSSFCQSSLHPKPNSSCAQAALLGQLLAEVLSRRQAKRHDAPSLALAAKLLELNPEVYTAWNFRREALEAVLDAGGAPAPSCCLLAAPLWPHCLLDDCERLHDIIAIPPFLSVQERPQ